MKNKRILVISNACFSETDANGYTLKNMFAEYDPEKISQFYVYGDPDYTACHSFYRVSDSEALESVFSFGLRSKAAGNHPQSHPYKRTTVHKSPLTHLIREFVWALRRWETKEFKEWLEAQRPDCIFLFMADSVFLMELSRRIAKKYKIPIIAYTTESYVFKNFNYISKKKSFAYIIFHKLMERGYNRCLPYIQSGLMSTPLLVEQYEKAYGYPCECQWQQSDLEFIDRSQNIAPDKLCVSYLGNLGLNRHKALMELADTLDKIVPGLRLNVYGNLPDEIRDEFLANRHIEYKGFVSRADVEMVMRNSTLLVHAEYSDPFNDVDLCDGFSTKISDSVSSGTPFLLYCSDTIAASKILHRYGSAFVVNNRAELQAVLRKALFDAQARANVVRKAEHMKRECFNNRMPLHSAIEASARKR